MRTCPDSKFSLSVIIPTLNEAPRIARLLDNIQAVRDAQPDFPVEVIVVDGGSTDQTFALTQHRVDRFMASAAGRAIQMNAGAAHASHTTLLFLHADTLLPLQAVSFLRQAFDAGASWGRFNVQFDAPARRFRGLAWMMNGRSRLTGICTGDQGIFVQRYVFQAIGGYAPIALMEDVELSRRLRRLQRPACIQYPVITASRRWQQRGYWSTVWLMWSLRWRYFFGASPAALAKIYYPKKDGPLTKDAPASACCDVTHD
ncbi:MAG: rSAM/selenodomain-associated transferase 2 [Candidatus Azotimanducaceae bacterium]|jgi:rSAM/selenodomain-associated transferase 2